MKKAENVLVCSLLLREEGAQTRKGGRFSKVLGRFCELRKLKIVFLCAPKFYIFIDVFSVSECTKFQPE
jgi:hypothetical protein